MKIPFDKDWFTALSDDTNEIDEQTLFLKTVQNSQYYEKLQFQAPFITPKELIAYWQLGTMRVVGVTGTNGKTTVTAAIYSILIDLGEHPALQGTRGFFAMNEQMEVKNMTTPSIFQTIYHMKLAQEKGCNYFIMEVSSHAIDQDRIEGIDFALKAHTNVTSDHLDYHKTVEEYRAVKSRFFADESPKLLNKDEIKYITYNPINAQSYGVEEAATFKVMAYSLNDGISAVIKHFAEEETFFSDMVGLFNLYNLTAAIASCQLLTKLPLSKICEAVEHFGGVGGRMEVVSKDPLVIVDFAHTDDGMYKVLDSMKDKDLVVVFGAGGNRDKGKRPRMGAVAGRFAKRIYVTSDNPRDEIPEAIIEEILQGLKGKEHVFGVLDRRLAIKMAIESLSGDEILLILGKGDETYQEIKGVKHPFDDREVVKELLPRAAK